MLCIHPSCIDGPQCSKAGELDSKSGWGGSIPSGVATDERYCWLIELVPAPSSIHTADVKPARYACDPRKYHTHVTECPYSAMHFPTRAEAEAAFPHLPFVAGWSFLVTDHLFTHQRANREAPPAQGPTVNGAAIFGAIKLKDIT